MGRHHPLPTARLETSKGRETGPNQTLPLEAQHARS
ncbi:hypothetical protein SEA_SUSHI23_3 [Streptomyces phage Sushi23]|uniref:Uncharacterized protein n=1 Tax=Streptomyces phage Sushi23 TaxID=2015806 RepID=A0A222YYN0_9CAUD|nr:hypothetical protein SEA_SUSHI23_3 [Streptomyces phage Sushi23]